MPAPARRGIADARACCAAVARMLDCAEHEVLPFSTGVIMEPLPVDRIVAALPRCRAALSPIGMGCGGARDHDHRHGAQGRLAPRRDRRRAGHRDRHGQGRGHDRSQHGDDARLRRDRRAGGAIAARRARGKRRRTRRSIASRSTATRRPTTASSWSRPARRRSHRSLATTILACRHCAPRSKRSRWGWRRRSCATARERPNSSPSPSTAVAMRANAIASRARSRIRRWSRRRFSPPIPISDVSFAPSATRRSRTSIRRCVSFWLDDVLVVADGGRAATYREQDGKRVMAQAEIRRPRRAGSRRRRGDGVDLRPVARLRHDQRGLPQLATP